MGGGGALSKLHTEKEIIPDTQMFSILSVWYHLQVPKAASANPTRCSAEAGSESAPRSCRVHPFTPGWQRPHRPGKYKQGDTGSALLKHALMQENREKYPYRFREKKSAQHLKGGSMDSPPHPAFKEVLLTLVVEEQLEEALTAISSLPPSLPIVPNP